jgi:hypothetical protein
MGETQQLARHQQEPVSLGAGRYIDHSQVDKNARQVKQAGKPTGHKNDME